MPTVELLFRPSITAPHRCAARNTSQPAAVPLRLMVTTLPPPVYTPSFTITVSPGLVTSAACCNVRQGAALVPALASLPAAASTLWHTLAQLPGGGAAVTVMAAVPLLASLVAVIVAEPTWTHPPPFHPRHTAVAARPRDGSAAERIARRILGRRAELRRSSHEHADRRRAHDDRVDRDRARAHYADARRRPHRSRDARRGHGVVAAAHRPVMTVVPPALAARVEHAAGRAPRHGDRRRIARGREADGREVLCLVLLQRDDLRCDEKLGEVRARVRDGDGVLAAEHHRGGERRGGHAGDPVFQARQPARQLVHEGHGFCGVWITRRDGQSAVRRARTAALPPAALVSERRCDSLNPNGMDDGVPFTARRGLAGGEDKRPPGKNEGASRWRARRPSDVASP